MRIAIIDLGTNSVRFDVHQLSSKKKVKQLHREKIMVRLGQGVFLNGKLDKSAVQRTLHAFQRFKDLAKHYKVNKTVAFGTSALREVGDRDRFLQAIHQATGIDVRVISGSEEAQLIALGILTREKAQKGKLALVDIGGGSTEVSVCQGKKILHSYSFPLGTARLQQLFLDTSPPSSKAIGDLRHFIRTTLYGVTLTERWPKVNRIIGSSGTIRAISKLLRKGTKDNEIELGKLRDLNEQMAFMNTTELLGISGMESKRVDMILAGAILFEEIMDVLGAKKALTTEFSLRDGILEEEQRIYRQGNSSHLALHLPDLIDRARIFGCDQARVERTLPLADQVFDLLASVHRLKSEWKIYLKAATILRDVGEAVSPNGHEQHSYYIVKNADFPAAEGWEIEWIARLCRHHEGSKLDRKDLSFVKEKGERETFVKLLALLQLVDAFDSGPEAKVKLGKPKLSAGIVCLPFSGSCLTGLESLNIEKISEFFEEAMGRQIVTVRAGRGR